MTCQLSRIEGVVVFFIPTSPHAARSRSFVRPRERCLCQTVVVLTQWGLNFPPGFHRAVTMGHHSARHRTLQGIPELNIADCKWKRKQSVIGVKVWG